ncbi:MAG: hypothetical protein HC887_08305 [Desulfobacteraceae bacterium]|nr:hypothetical protein [Desulfobacteraceae bacterium]
MTENFPFVTSGRNVQLARNNIETARLSVSELKKQGATLIIALTHIGTPKDREIAETIPDIDVIFGGHSHDYISPMEKVGKTIIVNGGEKGAYLVRLDISADTDGKMISDQAKFQLIPVKNDIVPDAEIETMLSQYRQSFPKAVVLGRTEVGWNMTKENPEAGRIPSCKSYQRSDAEAIQCGYRAE